MNGPYKLQQLRICSFNMHGFNSGHFTITLLCNNYDVILIQEHWLQSSERYKLGEIGSDFASFGLSPMNTKCFQDILMGRPFGVLKFSGKKHVSPC